MAVTKAEAARKKQRVLNYPGLQHLIDVLDERYKTNIKVAAIPDRKIDSIIGLDPSDGPRGGVQLGFDRVTNSDIEEIVK